MDLKNYSTAIFVKDIAVSKYFYSNILGMVIELDLGKNVIFRGGLTIWEIQENHIIPRQLGVKNISERSSNRFEIYFETEDIDEVFSRLKKADVIFLHEIHEEPWGQFTFRFFDPDKHLIEIGESMISFLTRMQNEGLSISEICKKTSVPEGEIRRIIGGNS
jgi:catechol 2,3-dioxygenase-like lactoylglutathione lyase family enzyme